MSGVFYVFLKWSPNNDVSASHYGRYMLCLNSRYDADELFRAMQGLRTANGSDLMFPLLTRQSPQFWCYDSPENWVSIGLFQERNQLPEFKNRLSLLLLNDRGGREWPIIPNPVSGPDWVSGGNFFIRNRRQPNIYWNLHDTHIYTSTKRRTKFHIQKIKSKGEREPVIMIREDTVTIQVIPETVTSEAVADGSTYVSIGNSNGHRLTLTRVETKWTFGELVNEKVGVRWEGERNSPEQPPAAQPFLVHMSNGGGDEWELV